MLQASRIQSPQDIIAILWRRKWLLIIPAFVLFAISVAVALTRPPIYQSKATILIEEPNVSGEFLEPITAGYADQRVQVISQQVLSRQNLILLIEKFDLYSDVEDSGQLAAAAASLRESIQVEFISAEVNDPRMAGRRQATIAFVLSFNHEDPQTAQKVTAELVSLYLAQNLKDRQEKASETAGFLAREADKLAQKIDELETKLAAFKSQHTGSLPDQISLTQQAMYRIELQLLELRQEIQAQEERRVFLEAQLTQVSPYASITLDDGTVLRPEERMKKLEAEYSELSYIYGPRHPRMIEISTELESLRSRIGGTGEGTEKPSNPVYIQLQADLKAVNANLGALRSQRADLSSRFDGLQSQSLKAPDIEREFLLITRNYDNAQAEYRAVREKLAEAERRESLETDSQNEHFSVIEPPEVPLRPISPNRKMLVLIGFMISAVGGLGAAAVAEVLDQSVSSPRHLAAIAGTAPLVVIPEIKAGAGKQRAWQMSFLVVFAVTVVCAGGLFVVNNFVVPLGDLWVILGPGAGST